MPPLSPRLTLRSSAALLLTMALAACGASTPAPSQAAPTQPSSPAPAQPAPAPTPTPAQPAPPQPAPVQPVPAPTQPAPAPTLQLSQAALTLQSTQTLSLPLTLSQVPDRVEVTGNPSGLSAVATPSGLTLDARNVTPGTYALTVTAFWGTQSSRATLALTVIPVPATAPALPAPDFGLTLSQQSLSLTTGQRGNVTVTVTPNAGLQGPVSLGAVVSAGPGGLLTSLSGTLLTVDAANALPGTHTVTVTGQGSGTPVRQTTLQVTVLAPAPTPARILGVSVSAGTNQVQPGDSFSVRANLSGTGAFDPSVTWSVSGVSGATITPQGSAGATVSVPAGATSGTLVVTASSVADPRVWGRAEVAVVAQPQVVTVSVPAGGLSLTPGGTAVLAMSGTVRSAWLEQPLAQISGVRLVPGGLEITATQVAGSGTAQIAFLMEDGGTQRLGLPVSVTAPAPAPAPTPGGYQWYPASDRAASSQELEVLRLTNEARAQGQTCGQTAYPPAPPLTWDDRLAHAARNHALDMGLRSYFAHATPEGVTPAQRVTLAGYVWSTTGENIAAGYRTPAEVVAGWIGSPGHCVNLMNPAYKHLGVGFVEVPGSPYVVYSGQNFGALR